MFPTNQFAVAGRKVILDFYPKLQDRFSLPVETDFVWTGKTSMTRSIATFGMGIRFVNLDLIHKQQILNLVADFLRLSVFVHRERYHPTLLK